MFANYDSGKTVTNLAEWKVNSTSESNGATETNSNNVIQPDLTASNVGGNWSAPESGKTKSHNGVAWSKDSSSSSTDSQVVIKGNANIYRSKFTSGSTTTQYQTFFGYSDNTEPKTVEIKITVNKTSSVR